MKPVDRVRADLDSGVEAEGEVGRVDVVVDGLGNSDYVDSLGVQLVGDTEGVLATDGYKTVDAFIGQARLDSLETSLLLEGIRARRTEDRASSVKDSRGVVGGQADVPIV